MFIGRPAPPACRCHAQITGGLACTDAVDLPQPDGVLNFFYFLRIERRAEFLYVVRLSWHHAHNPANGDI